MSQTTLTGYRKRPWELTVLAAGFALVPLISWIAWYLPFLVAGRPESMVQVLVNNFSTAGNGPLGLAHAVLVGVLWVLFLLVAWGVFRVTKRGFVLCIVAAVANSLFSTVLYGVTKGTDGIHEVILFNVFQPGVLVNLVFFIPVIVLLRQKIMAPFFNPRLKWWEQHPRVKANLKIEATIGGEQKDYQSFDISASGMFLGTGEVPGLVIGSRFPATIHVEDLGLAVEVECETVWISDGKGRSPVGCGVTFRYRKRAQRRALGRYLKQQIKEGNALERT